MASRCKIDGCEKLGKLTKGKRYFERGYCGMHYQRLMKGKPLDGAGIRDRRSAIIEGDVAKIPLGVEARDGYAQVDREYAWLDKYSWSLGTAAGGYAVGWVDGKNIRMQHLILGQQPPLVTDHINHDKLDNRKSNLRLVSIQQNAMNSKARSLSGYKGVSRNRNRWNAKLTLNGRSINGGTYDTVEEAAEAYNKLAIKHFGQYAKLNVIDKLKEGRDD